VRAADPEAVSYYKSESKAPELIPFTPDIVAVSQFNVLLPVEEWIRAKLKAGCGDCARFPSGRLAPAVPSRACACGLQYNEADFVKLGLCNVFLLTGMITREMFALDCPRRQNACRISYDGTDHALWVVNATTAFSVVVFIQCLEEVSVFDFEAIADVFVVQMRRQRGSLTGYHECQKSLYYLHGGSSFCSYSQFRRCFFSFLPYVRAANAQPTCPICKDCPDVVHCDGASCLCAHYSCCCLSICTGSFFSMSKSLLGENFVSITQPCSDAAEQSDPYLNRLDRCFIEGSRKENTRAALRALAGVRTRAGDSRRLDLDDLASLLADCPAPTRCDCTHLGCVVHWFIM
jgi:hypothetical protein